MSPKSSQPRRHGTRLRGYDYGQTGGYFVTICVQDQKCLFGKIIDGRMQLNEIGKIVVECWNRIPQHFFSAELDSCVIMPNHIHGVILLGTGGSKCPCPPSRSQPNRSGRGPLAHARAGRGIFQISIHQVHQSTSSHAGNAYLAKELLRPCSPRRHRFRAHSPIHYR